MRLDGQDLFLTVTNKIAVENDAAAPVPVGSELQFVNTGLPTNSGVTDDKPLATISAQADGIVSSQILMEDAIVGGDNQGVISFDVMVDGNLVTLMEMNKPSREDASNYDSTIYIPHNMDVIGDLYTNTMEFAEKIVPDDPGGATIGDPLLPWGDLYLYDGNAASAQSAHIYFQNEGEAVADVEISHEPGDGIRIKGDKQIQFNSENSYIFGSGTNPNEILNLVAPTLSIQHSTAATDVQMNIDGSLTVDGTMDGLYALIEDSLTIGANGNEFTISENSAVAGEIFIRNKQSNKDMVFNVNDGGTNTEVFRVSGTNSSVQMNTDKKIAFRDENTYVHSDATDELDMLAGQSIDLRAATINLKASTDTNTVVQVTGKIKADGSFILYDGAVDEFKIYQGQAASSQDDDYIIKNVNSNEDIIFEANKAGSAVEVMRVQGSTAALMMKDTNMLMLGNTTNYVRNTGTKLNIVSTRASGGGTVKLGKVVAGVAIESTHKVEVEADEFNVYVPDAKISSNTDEKPVLTLESSYNDLESSAKLELSKDRGTPNLVHDVLGEIVATGNTPGVDYASVVFEAKGVTGGIEIGAIYFETAGTNLPADQNNRLMDINGSDTNTVTIQGDLDVSGAITMNGADFTAPITSSPRGAHTLGTLNKEWADLHLYDNNSSDADLNTDTEITFGDGSDDLVLTHDPVNAGLTFNDGKKIQLRNANTYILNPSGSADTLTLVAPILHMDASGTSKGVVINAGTHGVDLNTTGEVNIASAKDAVSAVVVSATHGGIDIIAAGAGIAAGDDIDITATGSSVNISSSEDAVDAVTILSSGGGIDISATGADVAAGDDIDITATLSSVIITSTEDVADALRLNASAGGIDIDGNSSTIHIKNTSGAAGDDITILQAGANDASLIFTSEGTGADAIKVNTNAGGIDIDAAPLAAYGANPSLAITNTATAAAQDLTIAQAGAFDASLDLSSEGTGADAIKLNASSGGIDITATSVMNFDVGGSMSIDPGASVTWDNNTNALAINKENVIETLSSDQTDLPQFVINNITPGTAGSIVMRKSVGEADAGILGSIKAKGTANDYVSIDLMSEAITGTGQGAVEFKVKYSDNWVPMLRINSDQPNTVTIGNDAFPT
ncbi:MAG: hypothetical protein VYE78_05190, partial [Candidatus Thermoplasmatota archaeon]|nr:hypothetical protein [Candidatus Thermoplasmatota archaeon]